MANEGQHNCGCDLSDADCVRDLVTSQAVQTERLSSIDKKLDRCLVGLYGAKDAPNRGLIVRVDRLEQVKKMLVLGLFTVFSGVVALMLNAIASFASWKH